MTTRRTLPVRNGLATIRALLLLLAGAAALEFAVTMAQGRSTQAPLSGTVSAAEVRVHGSVPRQDAPQAPTR